MYAFIFVPDFPMCTVTACHTFLGTHFDRVEWLAGVSAVSTTWRVDATTTARIIWNWRYLILEYFELEWNKKQVFYRAELFKMEKLGWKQKEIGTGWYRVSWVTILTDELIIFKDNESWYIQKKLKTHRISVFFSRRETWIAWNKVHNNFLWLRIHNVVYRVDTDIHQSHSPGSKAPQKPEN